MVSVFRRSKNVRVQTLNSPEATLLAFQFSLEKAIDSDCLVAAFAGANTNAVIHWQHKDLSIPNLAAFTGTSTFQNRIDCGLDKLFIDGDLQLHFAQ